MMIASEIKLISEKTRHVVDAATHTIQYATAIIEQSKRLIRSINEPPYKVGRVKSI